jgi:uncharacterized membrane protein HdeD (DUF308 family)
MALPQFISMAIAWFAGWLMLIAGGLAFITSWYGFRDRWTAWLKPFVLLILGLLLLLHPLAGAAALGLVLAIYFLLDGFAGVGAALELRPQPGWKWLLFNGALSLLLGLIFIIGWPFTAPWLIGFFIGISLFIDGVTLLMVSLAAQTD